MVHSEGVRKKEKKCDGAYEMEPERQIRLVYSSSLLLS